MLDVELQKVESQNQQGHCCGAKMTSFEFVRLFKDTPGAIVNGSQQPSTEKKIGSIKSNDLELIFAREKRRGEKCISFRTFLVHAASTAHLWQACCFT